jgi:hypothetical protein
VLPRYWTTTDIEDWLDFDDGYTVLLAGRLSLQVRAALLIRQCLVTKMSAGCVMIVAADYRKG